MLLRPDLGRRAEDPAGADGARRPGRLSVLPLVVLFIVMRKQVIRSLGSVVMR